MRRRDEGGGGRRRVVTAMGVFLLAAAAGAETLSGRVVDLLSGAPVAGARVEIPGTAAGSSDVDGEFAIDGAPAAVDLRLVATASGFLERETSARAGEPVTVELLPESAPGFAASDFDLLSRMFFGRAAEAPLRGHLARWARRPKFLIANRVCDRGIWGARLPDAVFEEARERLRYGSPLLSGGFVTARKVRRKTVREGAADTGFLEAARKRQVRICLGAASGVAVLDEEIETGRLVSGWFRAPYDLGTGSFSRYVFFHELGHALGFSHPAGFRAFELPTVMGTCGDRDEPEDFDVLAALVHYSRPPGNRHPDRDPAPLAAARSSRTVRRVWDDGALSADGAAAGLAGVGLAEIRGAVSRRDEPCPESLGKPCAIHRIELAAPVAALRARLTWPGRKAGLGLHLVDPEGGVSRALEARSLPCRRQEVATAALETASLQVGPGTLEVRVLYWSGRRARQRYTLEIFGDDP